MAEGGCGWGWGAGPGASLEESLDSLALFRKSHAGRLGGGPVRVRGVGWLGHEGAGDGEVDLDEYEEMGEEEEEIAPVEISSEPILMGVGAPDPPAGSQR